MKILHVQIDQLPEGYEGILLSACADGKQLLSGEESLVVTGELPLNDSSKDLIKSLQVTAYKLLQPTSLVPDPVPYDTNPVTWDHKGGEKTLSREVCPSGGATVQGVIELYNEAALRNDWQRVRVVSSEIKKRLEPAIKALPRISQWELVLRGWEADRFFSGKSGQYDRIKIHTMLFKKRYEEFYADALAMEDGPKDGSVEAILARWDRLQDGAQA